MKIGRRYYYRSSDRKVTVAMLFFAAVCVGLIVVVGNHFLTSETPSATDSTAVSSFRPNRTGKQSANEGYYVEPQKAELFPFDPNTADSTALLRLGLQPWQVRNIYKYRAHGGVYRKPSDFAKLYGLTVKQYRQLEPYIRISSDYQPAATLYANEKHERDTLRFPTKLKPTERIDINCNDTSLLKRVPGIGSFFAHSIVRYGQKLGGYVAVEQLDEIENFPEEAKSYFVIKPFATKRLNVNKLSLAQLRQHPYIGFYRARTICEYRRLHGDIKSLDELKLDRDFTAEAISRLRPYVEY